VLFAAILHNSGGLAPNLIAQVLRLALLLPPGRLAVSIYESGSNDLSRQWLSLLRMLLLPLGVPHNVTLGGALAPRVRKEGGRVAYLAALRNAALEPFLSGAAGEAAAPSTAGAAAGGALRLPSAATSAATDAGPWRPDAVVFANDVFFCAEDVLRLLAHGADLACGLDFYTGSWQQAAGAGEGAGGRTGSGGSGGRGGEEDMDDVMLLRQIEDGQEGQDGGGSLAATAARRRGARRLSRQQAWQLQAAEALDQGGEEQQQQQLQQRMQQRLLQQQGQQEEEQQSHPGGAEAQLRFYDKVRPARRRGG
jgi:hypothetical protein